MNVRYRVTLSREERSELQALVSGGKGAARRIKRAQILLAADAGTTSEVIALNVATSTSTVYRTKQRFVEEGLEAALREEPRPGAERKLSGNEEALLVATACSSPPPGRARWTMSLLADQMVRLTPHKSLSPETVRRRLAENQLKPWQQKMWCIPRVDAEFVARMEDVLELYAESPDRKRPVVCFDETPRQLIGEARIPIAAKPGRPARVDYEYVRNGTANVFMFFSRPPTFGRQRSSILHTAASGAAANVPASYTQPRAARQLASQRSSQRSSILHTANVQHPTQPTFQHLTHSRERSGRLASLLASYTSNLTERREAERGDHSSRRQHASRSRSRAPHRLNAAGMASTN
jgi:transposase